LTAVEDTVEKIRRGPASVLAVAIIREYRFKDGTKRYSVRHYGEVGVRHEERGLTKTQASKRRSEVETANAKGRSTNPNRGKVLLRDYAPYHLSLQTHRGSF
jgi:hypothetical protein